MKKTVGKQKQKNCNFHLPGQIWCTEKSFSFIYHQTLPENRAKKHQNQDLGLFLEG